MGLRFEVTWPNGKIDTEQELREFGNFFKKEFIKIAKNALLEEIDIGFDRNAKIKTDNRWNVPLENVIPFGKVEWHSRIAPAEALLDIYMNLIKLSPVRTGYYLNAHFVFIGPKLVASSYEGLKAYLKTNGILEKQVIRFIPGAVYARKLERYAITSKGGGKARLVKSRRDKTKMIRKPNGVYYRTYRAIRRSSGQLGFIDFGLFKNGDYGITLSVSGVRDTYASGKSMGRPYLRPMITVYPFKEGMAQ